MENRDGRSRSAMESMQRRQLEARRLSESSPIAGMGTYQVMRPSRGREIVRTRPSAARPGRLPDGSDSFGTIDRQEVPLETPPHAVEPPPPEDRTMLVAARLYRAEIAPPLRDERRGSGWFLPMALATIVSAILITLALTLR